MAKKKRITILADDDDRNADWLQAAKWDVWTTDGQLVENLALLRSVFPSYTNRRLKEFLQASSVRVMPAQLRSELEALEDSDYVPPRMAGE